MSNDEMRHQPDPEVERRDRRTRILSNIAAFLIVTSIMAGAYCASIWYEPVATDLDLFLFLYAIVAFFIGCVIQIPITCDEGHSCFPWKWWL